MKWFKRLLLTVSVVVVVLALVGGYLYFFRYQGTPDWYPVSKKSDPAAEAAAARRVEMKVTETLNWAAASEARQDRERYAARRGAGTATTHPATVPANPDDVPFTLTFTEEELNAFFAKWEKLYDWDQKYGAYVSDPAIALHDGRLVLAGRSKDLGAVLSVHFKPELGPTTEAADRASDDPAGARPGLYLRLDKVLAGTLSVPQSFFDKQRDALAHRLKTALPSFQREATIQKDGTANPAAVAAAMGKLALCALGREPAAPILFLPIPGKGSVPVEVTDVKIQDNVLTLTFQLLGQAERQALLAEIQEPYEKDRTLTVSVGAE